MKFFLSRSSSNTGVQSTGNVVATVVGVAKMIAKVDEEEAAKNGLQAILDSLQTIENQYHNAQHQKEESHIPGSTQTRDEIKVRNPIVFAILTRRTINLH